MSWSPTGLPLKADGTLDYARLTSAQICEDLLESLSDMVVNGALDDLIPFLNDCPDSDQIRDDAMPSGDLVLAMEQLLRWEETDVNFRSEEARSVLATAIQELRSQATET